MQRCQLLKQCRAAARRWPKTEIGFVLHFHVLARVALAASMGVCLPARRCGHVLVARSIAHSGPGIARGTGGGGGWRGQLAEAAGEMELFEELLLTGRGRRPERGAVSVRLENVADAGRPQGACEGWHPRRRRAAIRYWRIDHVRDVVSRHSGCRPSARPSIGGSGSTGRSATGNGCRAGNGEGSTRRSSVHMVCSDLRYSVNLPVWFA